MNEAKIVLSEQQTASWADAQWRAGYLSGLQRFVAANITQVVVVADDGETVLGVYARAWSAV